MKTAVKKLVGSTDSPLGKAGDRSVRGGGGWRVGAMEDPINRGVFERPLIKH